MFGLIDGLLPLWLRVFIQLVDYLLKAADQWRETPEGAKEWADFQTLYEQALNDGAQSGVTFGVEDNPNFQQSAQQPAQPSNPTQTAQRRRGGVVIQNKE